MYNHIKTVIDPIMHLNSVFLKDTSPTKMNLIIGAYRDKMGKPYIFKSVKEAISKINRKTKNFEYLPITGDQEYIDLCKKLYFEKHHDGFDGVQSLSGTGALRLAGDLIKKTYPDRNIYLPNPTWENHDNVFSSCGLNTFKYDYLHHNKFIFGKMYDSMKNIPANNVILLHACAHNPTGYDLSSVDWKHIVSMCVERGHLMLVDCAYLGFASGNIQKDSTLLQIINEYDVPWMVCSSFAKNFGLYSKRTGNLFFRGKKKEETVNMKDVLRRIIRTNYSNPPSDGSEIVKTILKSDYLTYLWKSELADISDHYSTIRLKLKDKLESELNRDFYSIVVQQGMFYFAKNELSEDEIKHMRDNHIYFLDNGRISLAGLNDENIETFAKTLKKFAPLSFLSLKK